MSTVDSPAIAALKARLEQQPSLLEGNLKLKGLPPQSKKKAADASKKKASATVKRGKSDVHMKLNKQLDSTLGHGRVCGPPGPLTKATSSTPPPPLKLKPNSPGPGKDAVKDGWQHKTPAALASSNDHHQDNAALLSLSRAQQCQSEDGNEGGDEVFQSRARSVQLRAKGRIKSIDFTSRNDVKKEIKIGGRASSVDSSLSGEEEACPLVQSAEVKDEQKKFVIKCLESSISSNEGDSCDIKCDTPSDVTSGRRPSSSRRRSECSARLSEGDTAPSMTRQARKDRLVSQLSNELYSPEQKKKPLPTPPKKPPPILLPQNVLLKKTRSTRSASDVTNSGQNPAIPVKPKSKMVAPKPSTLAAKPAVVGAKPVVVKAKPSVSSSQLSMSNRKRLSAGHVEVHKVSLGKSNLSATNSDQRKKPPPPPNPPPQYRKGGDRNGTDQSLHSDSTKTLGKQNVQAPPTKLSAPLKSPHIGELRNSSFSSCAATSRASPEVASADSQVVRDGTGIENDVTRSSSVELASENLDDTLTATQSHDLDVAQLSGSMELSGEWVVVGEHTDGADKSSTSNIAASSPDLNSSHPPVQAAVDHRIGNSCETEIPSSPPSPSTLSSHRKSKPLPSLPSLDRTSPIKRASSIEANPKSSNVDKVSAPTNQSHSTPSPVPESVPTNTSYTTPSPKPSSAFPFSGKSVSVESDDALRPPAAISLLSPAAAVTPGSTHSGK